MISDRVLRKIERCLALSRSANEHEADTALRQAQRLMTKHNTSEIDVAASNIDRAAMQADAGRKPPRWLNRLATLVNAAFGTATVYEPRPAFTGWQGYFAFLGQESQVRIAAYAFEVLQRQLVSDRKAFLVSMNKRAKRIARIRRADAYATAWVSNAYEHLIPIEKSEDALTVIEHFKARFYTILENLYVIDRGQCRDDQKTMMKDYLAGRNAHFYSGVEQERRGGADSWLRF